MTRIDDTEKQPDTKRKECPHCFSRGQWLFTGKRYSRVLHHRGGVPVWFVSWRFRCAVCGYETKQTTYVRAQQPRLFREDGV